MNGMKAPLPLSLSPSDGEREGFCCGPIPRVGPGMDQPWASLRPSLRDFSLTGRLCASVVRSSGRSSLAWVIGKSGATAGLICETPLGFFGGGREPLLAGRQAQAKALEAVKTAAMFAR
jgi:hypothetical protein